MKINLLVFVLCTIPLINQGQITTKQDVAYAPFPVKYHFPQPPEGMWENFQLTLLQEAEILSEQELHPLRTGFWFVERDRDGNNANFTRNRSEDMFDVFSTAVVYGLREATLDLPAVLWFESLEDTFGKLLEGSIGGTTEELVEPLSTEYSTAERRWWKRIKLEGMSYGVRPFSDRPYAYTSFKPWRIFDESDVLVHLRYYPKDLQTHTFEGSVYLELPANFSFDVGGRYDIKRSENEHHITAKLFRHINGKSTFYIAADISERSSFYVGFHRQF